MPDDFSARVAQADLMADSLCARRLINAVLTTIAVWLLCAMFARREFLEVGGEVWFVVAIAVTFATAAFSAWAFVFGDRRAWARAVERAARIEENSADE
jgi:hypothetical protein